MKLLHIIATPRGARSRTLALAAQFLETVASHRPDLEVTTLDLTRSDLPPIDDSLASIKDDLIAGIPIDTDEVPGWVRAEELIDQFLAADSYLLTAPMWNFGLPYRLKHYIDCIVQPGHTFRFIPNGVEPLVVGRRMVCITSRGSDYSAGSPYAAFDFQEPYLRTIFGFIGITDIEFVHAQPMDHPLLRDAALAAAQVAVADLAGRPHWAAEEKAS